MDSPNSARFRLADRGDIPAGIRWPEGCRWAGRPTPSALTSRRTASWAAAMNDDPPDPPGQGASRPNGAFQHRPVMADEIVELFSHVPPGVLIDATVGGGGHAALLLAARPDCSLVGLDRDRAALAAAEATLRPFVGRVQ